MVVYTLEQRWEILRQINLQKMPILVKKKITFSGEAHFDLCGHVNKQNFCIWGTENPHAYTEKPTHPKRVTVWCGFWMFLRKWARKDRYNAGKWAYDRLTEDADFGKKKTSFQMKLILILAGMSHLGHRKPARINWKADASKTGHCSVRI